MGYEWVEQLSSKTKKRVIKELVEGQGFAYQLKNLLHNCSVQEQGPAQDLAWKIMRSFSDSLSALSSRESSEVSQNQAASNCQDSRCTSDRRSEESGESRRKKPASKDRRGCYKRKRSAEAWTVVSSTVDDGHAWRKYGQKQILNSNHPRSYYRCSRKYDRGCKATKQVQRMEEDPQKFHTIYLGAHTCRDTTKAEACVKQEDGREEIDMDPNMWKDLIGLEIGPDFGDLGVTSGLYSKDLELAVGFEANEFRL